MPIDPDDYAASAPGKCPGRKTDLEDADKDGKNVRKIYSDVTEFRFPSVLLDIDLSHGGYGFRRVTKEAVVSRIFPDSPIAQCDCSWGGGGLIGNVGQLAILGRETSELEIRN